jgi:hypothetical protein
MYIEFGASIWCRSYNRDSPKVFHLLTRRHTCFLLMPQRCPLNSPGHVSRSNWPWSAKGRNFGQVDISLTSMPPQDLEQFSSYCKV